MEIKVPIPINVEPRTSRFYPCWAVVAEPHDDVLGLFRFSHHAEDFMLQRLFRNPGLDKSSIRKIYIGPKID